MAEKVVFLRSFVIARKPSLCFIAAAIIEPQVLDLSQREELVLFSNQILEKDISNSINMIIHHATNEIKIQSTTAMRMKGP